MDDATNRLTGSFLSRTIVNVSKRIIAQSETELLEKGSEFVLTSEKI